MSQKGLKMWHKLLSIHSREWERVLSTSFTVKPLRHHCFCGCVLRMSHCASAQQGVVVYLTRFFRKLEASRDSGAAQKHTTTAAAVTSGSNSPTRLDINSTPEWLARREINDRTVDFLSPCCTSLASLHQPWQQRHKKETTCHLTQRPEKESTCHFIRGNSQRRMAKMCSMFRGNAAIEDWC